MSSLSGGIFLRQLQTTLYAALTSSSEMMQLIRAVYDDVPDNVTYPYMRFGASDVIVEEHVGGGHHYEAQMEILAYVRDGGRSRLLDAANELELLILGLSAISGFESVSARIKATEITLQKDTKTWRLRCAITFFGS